MKTLLAIAAVGAALTGLILLVYPPIAVLLLFGAEIAGPGIVMSRLAGAVLVGLGVACWAGAAMALAGMLTYSTLVTLYLVYLGIGDQWTGILLWPAVAAHAILSLFLTWACTSESSATEATA